MIFRIILFMALSFLLHLQADAQSSAQRQKHYLLDKQRLALEGYDPLSYFNGKPAKGKKDITHLHYGVTYHFSNVANRDAFKANPAKYEPAYGGWCAYAMSLKGEKVEVDPLTYKIVNGRLLLFYNAFFTNTLKSWDGQKEPEKERLAKGDASWAIIITQ